jgi:molybdopterin synthase sulfur carrier subunit
MKVEIRYFASIREALGPGEALDVAEGATVARVRDALIARGGAHASVLARGKALRTALNKMLCDDATLLQDGAELAFFPPVTGG